MVSSRPTFIFVNGYTGLKARAFGLPDVGCCRENNEDYFLIDEDSGLFRAIRRFVARYRHVLNRLAAHDDGADLERLAREAMTLASREVKKLEFAIIHINRTKEPTMAVARPSYSPTPKEIRQACARIQASWRENVRQSRLSLRTVSWSLPEINTAHPDRTTTRRQSLEST